VKANGRGIDHSSRRDNHDTEGTAMTSPFEKYLTTNQAAAILQVSPKTLVRWTQERRLAYARTLGGHRRFSERQILALRDSLTFTPEEERSS
jgi:excisionase family DNA binding protein